MAVLYLVFGSLWILGSDRAVDWLVSDDSLASLVQTIKGWGFIVVTAMLFFYVVSILIRERKRAIELLDNSRQDFLRLVEASNEGVWILNAEGETIFVNSRLAELLGVPKEELQERGPEDFLPQPWREASRRALRDRAQNSHDSYELRFACEDGRDLVMLVNGIAITDGNNAFGGSIRLLTDVTDMRRTNSQLLEAYESQRALLSELNHRVRNNLASLLSLIDLTKQRVNETDEFAETLRNRIFALSQAYSVTTQERRSPVLLEELIRALTTPAEGQRLRCEGSDVSVAVDRISALAIVLNELVSLSRRFGALGESHASVEVTWDWITTAHGDRLQLKWIEQEASTEADDVDRHPSTNLIESLSRADLRGRATVGTGAGGLEVTLELDVGEQERRDQREFNSHELSSTR